MSLMSVPTCAHTRTHCGSSPGRRPVVFDYIAHPAALADRAGRQWAALADGSLAPLPIERHTLDAAADAHARLESRRSGALVLVLAA